MDPSATAAHPVPFRDFDIAAFCIQDRWHHHSVAPHMLFRQMLPFLYPSHMDLCSARQSKPTTSLYRASCVAARDWPGKNKHDIATPMFLLYSADCSARPLSTLSEMMRPRQLPSAGLSVPLQCTISELEAVAFFVPRLPLCLACCMTRRAIEHVFDSSVGLCLLGIPSDCDIRCATG